MFLFFSKGVVLTECEKEIKSVEIDVFVVDFECDLLKIVLEGHVNVSV